MPLGRRDARKTWGACRDTKSSVFFVNPINNLEKWYARYQSIENALNVNPVLSDKMR
jgi:hypothetical protein